MALENSRWVVSDNDFALRVNTTTDEIKGWLSNSVVIEPGTKAFVVQEGQVLGELSAGEYTVKSFTEKLSFWRKGQTTIILVRSDIQPIEIFPSEVLTSDGMGVSVQARCSVQIGDMERFLNNLLGPRDSFSIVDLQQRTLPLLEQTLWHTVGSRTLKQVHSPAVAHEISKQAQSAINLSFQRYGINFLEFETISVASNEFGEFLKKNAEQKLATMKGESENTKMASDLAVMQQRIEVRQQLRDTVQSDKVDQINTKEDMARFLADINKGQVLRKEETDLLVEGFEQAKEDRQELRQHLVAIIDLNRQQEVDEVREIMSHDSNVRSIQNEIQVSELAGQKANIEWRRELQQQLEQNEHQNQLRTQQAEGKWNRFKELQARRRDDDWEQLVHQDKMESLRGDVELAEAQRKKRVAILEQEMTADLDQQKLAMERQRKEWEMEVADKESISQTDRLQRVQEMNLKMAQREQEMKLQMEQLRADKGHQREIERMQAMGALGTDALIASAGTDNAALLADLKKHESSEQGKNLQAELADKDRLNEERKEMYEKLSESEKSKADAIAQAYREAMQGQQANVQQMVSGLAQANTPPSPVVPPQIPEAVPPPPPAMAQWHAMINGQQQGPLQWNQVVQYIQSGHVNGNTMVWKTGMGDWLSANQIPELTSHLGNAAQGGPPPPPPV